MPCCLCDPEIADTQLTDTMSGTSKPSSENVSLQCASQPDVVNDPVCTEQTSAELGHSETHCTQLPKQLAAASHSLRLSTRGFEAMTVVVKRLSEKVELSALCVCPDIFQPLTVNKVRFRKSYGCRLITLFINCNWNRSCVKVVKEVVGPSLVGRLVVV